MTINPPNLGLFSTLVLGFAVFGLTSIPGTGATAAEVFSPCATPGPFSPRVNPDLLREDVRSQPSEMPTVRERRSRNAEEAQRAERGVCQDSRTGETIVMPDPPLNPQMKDYPGGDEGYPNLHQYNKRGESGNPFLLKASIFLPEGRKVQSPATSFPFRAVVKLLINFPLGDLTS